MAQKITAYQAEDGSIHADACAAATRDLEAVIAASPLAENGPFAKQLLAWMQERSAVILKVLGEYDAACPSHVRDRAPDCAIEDRGQGMQP